MYLPPAFEVTDEADAFDIIDTQGFGTLYTAPPASSAATDAPLQGGGPLISHLPFVLDRDRRRLCGHMARANPHWEVFAESAQSTVVFSGAHGYVSPAWYTVSDAVPTWNYEVVHVAGRAALVEDRDQLREQMLALVERFEGRAENAWRPPLDRPDYATRYERMLDVIVGFEIAIDELHAKAKMSQNRSSADQGAVIGALAKSSRGADHMLAERMGFYTGIEGG